MKSCLILMAACYLLTACGVQTPEPSATVVVQMVKKTSVLAEAVDSGHLTGLVHFGTHDLPPLEVEAGDTLSITYTGDIRETYPAGIDVTGWTLLKPWEPEEPSDKGPFDQPPPLTVNGMVEARTSSSCWGTVQMENELGEGVMICADAPHPLDWAESVPSIPYPFEEWGRITLEWPAQPDSVSVRYWTAEYLTGEPATPETNAAALPLDCDNLGIVLPPEDLPCLVMVYAEWEEGTLTDCWGNCGYGFYAVPSE